MSKPPIGTNATRRQVNGIWSTTPIPRLNINLRPRISFLGKKRFRESAGLFDDGRPVIEFGFQNDAIAGILPGGDDDT